MQVNARAIEAALIHWPAAAGGVATLVNHSENHTFRIDIDGVPRFSLRLHRPGYQSSASIVSELNWMTALQRDIGLPIPTAIVGRDGQFLQTISIAGQQRLAVLFSFQAGVEPDPDSDLSGLFFTLGQYAARMHLHAIAWQRPAHFTRQIWSPAHILDADGLWGDWRTAPGVDNPVRTVLDRLDLALRQRLAEYGAGPERYGLIHADMRLGNLLVGARTLTLIDFDDCGFCWFAYDFAAAISFHETSAAVPALKSAWLDGYQPIRALQANDIAAMDAMILLRRMALLAWIGSHHNTELARRHAPGFSANTAALAEHFLQRR